MPQYYLTFFDNNYNLLGDYETDKMEYIAQVFYEFINNYPTSLRMDCKIKDDTKWSFRLTYDINHKTIQLNNWNDIHLISLLSELFKFRVVFTLTSLTLYDTKVKYQLKEILTLVSQFPSFTNGEGELYLIKVDEDLDTIKMNLKKVRLTYLTHHGLEFLKNNNISEIELSDSDENKLILKELIKVCNDKSELENVKLMMCEDDNQTSVYLRENLKCQLVIETE
jgi:hypothetical protein